MSRPPCLLGITGGSGSGKTWLARRLLRQFGGRATLVAQDWYYRDHSALPRRDKLRLNFDHPEAFDGALFHRHLRELRGGRAVRAPRYDYATHRREPDGVLLRPRPLLIVEGILVLHEARVRRLLDLSVFVDTPADIRLLRRLRRDMEERGLPPEETLRLYEHCVRPMHDRFIQPTARWADLHWRPLERARFLERLVRDLTRRLG